MPGQNQGIHHVLQPGEAQPCTDSMRKMDPTDGNGGMGGGAFFNG